MRQDHVPYRTFGRCLTTGKAMYTSRKHAKAIARHYRDPDMQAFHCESCGYIHLGHSGGRDRQWHRDHRALKGA